MTAHIWATASWPRTNRRIGPLPPHLRSIEFGLVVRSSSPTAGFRSRDSLRWTTQASWSDSRPKA